MAEMQTPCDDWLEKISAFVDGELSAEEEAALKAHTDQCTGCRAALEAFESDKSRFVSALTEQKPTAEFTNAVLRRIQPPLWQTLIRSWQALQGFGRQIRALELVVVGALGLLLLAITFPMFARAREKARQASCQNNLVQLDRGIRMFISDQGRLPSADNWVEEIEPYLKNRYLFFCPSRMRLQDLKGLLTTYGFNPKLSNKRERDIDDPANTPMLYDICELGYPVARHSNDISVLFADGHVKAMRLRDFEPGKEPVPVRPPFKAGHQVPSSCIEDEDEGHEHKGSPPSDSYFRLPDNRKVAYEGEVTTQVGKADRALLRAEKLVYQHDGFLLQSSFERHGKRASAHLVLKVPAEEFMNALNRLGALGFVQARRVNGEDLTEKWVDAESAVTEHQVRQRELKQFYPKTSAEWRSAKSSKASEALRVEEKVQESRQEVLSQQSELRRMKGRTLLAVITATFTEPERIKPWTFSATLHAAMNSFKGTGRALLTAFIWLLIYAPLWVPAVVLAAWLKHSHKAKPPVRLTMERP